MLNLRIYKGSLNFLRNMKLTAQKNLGSIWLDCTKASLDARLAQEYQCTLVGQENLAESLRTDDENLKCSAIALGDICCIVVYFNSEANYVPGIHLIMQETADNIKNYSDRSITNILSRKLVENIESNIIGDSNIIGETMIFGNEEAEVSQDDRAVKRCKRLLNSMQGTFSGVVENISIEEAEKLSKSVLKVTSDQYGRLIIYSEPKIASSVRDNSFKDCQFVTMLREDAVLIQDFLSEYAKHYGSNDVEALGTTVEPFYKLHDAIVGRVY